MVERAERLADSSIGAPAGLGWTGRARHALAFGLNGPDNAATALAGFLVRGGIILLTLPGVVLPSVIGIAAAVGVGAFAIDGSPTARLYEIVALAVALAVVWLAVAGLIGSLVDVWLIQGAVDSDRSSNHGRPLPGGGLILDLVAVRGACLLPLVAALTWAASRIYSAAYAELVTPSNLAVPLFVRVAESAADAVVVVAVAWLASETVAALAVRRMVLAGDGIGQAIVGALVHIVRRPISTAMTVVVMTGASVLATAAAMLATSTSFELCLVAARSPNPSAVTIGLGPFSTTRDFRPIEFALAAALMAATWLSAGAVSGIVAAWRSAAWTAEVATTLTGPAVSTPAEVGGD
jgi:hypothetical protein